MLGSRTHSGVYRTVLVLHILCAIVGFGAVMLNAIYGAESKKRPGPEGIAVFDANYRVSRIGEYFIYAVFVLGFALVLLSDVVLEVQPDVGVAGHGRSTSPRSACRTACSSRR